MTDEKRKSNRPESFFDESYKADTQESEVIPRQRRRCLWLWMIVLLLTAILAAGVMIVLYEPEIFGMGLTGDLTATAQSFRRTEDALNSTAQFYAGLEIANVSTIAALDNRQRQLEQSETQAALDFHATRTAVAIANAQQATRAALDFEGTQSAFDRAATQVELDYRGTQAAINRNATTIALGFATEAPSANDVLSQTPPPTLTGVPLFDDGFNAGVSASLWQFGSVEDWSLSDEGFLTARRSGAWLLARARTLEGYALDVEIRPLTGPGLAADYYILLNVQDSPDTPGGIALRLSYDDDRLIAAGLFRFTHSQVFDDVGLLDAGLEAIRAVQVNIPPAEILNIRVEWRDRRLMAVVNWNLALDITLVETAPSGAVGIQVPVGTQIRRIALYP